MSLWQSKYSLNKREPGIWPSLTSNLFTFPALQNSIIVRLDPAVHSHDLMSSVHAGDRVLEVNGIPVRNISQDEVGFRIIRWLLITSNKINRKKGEKN